MTDFLAVTLGLVDEASKGVQKFKAQLAEVPRTHTTILRTVQENVGGGAQMNLPGVGTGATEAEGAVGGISKDLPVIESEAPAAGAALGIAFSKAMPYLAGAAAAVAIVYEAIHIGAPIVQAAEQAQTDLANAFKNTGTSLPTAEIQKLNDQGEKLGFTNAQTEESLAMLTRTTGNARTAANDLGEAQNIARARHISLTDATNMLDLAYEGNTRALKALGIGNVSAAATSKTLATDTAAVSAAQQRVAADHIKAKDALQTYEAIVAKDGPNSETAIHAREALSAANQKLMTDNAKLSAAHQKLTTDSNNLAGSLGRQTTINDALQHHVGGLADSYTTTLGGAWDNITSKISDFIAGVGENIQNWFSANSGTIGKVATVLINVLGGAFSVVGKVIGVFVAILRPMMPFVAGLAVAFGLWGLAIGAVAVAQGIATLATGAWGVAVGIFNLIMDANPIALFILGVTAVIGIIILVATHFKQVSQVIGAVWNDITGFFKTGVQDVLNIVGGIIKWFHDLPGNIVKALGGFLGTVGGFFKNVWNSITTDVGNFVGGVVNWISQLPGRIGSGLGAFFSTIMNDIKGAVNNIPVLGGLLSHIGLAEGGIVTKPTFALLGEGGENEYVIPESKLGKSGGSGIMPLGSGGSSGGSGGGNVFVSVSFPNSLTFLNNASQINELTDAIGKRLATVLLPQRGARFSPHAFPVDVDPMVYRSTLAVHSVNH